MGRLRIVSPFQKDDFEGLHDCHNISQFVHGRGQPECRLADLQPSSSRKMCADQVGLLCLLKQSRLFPTSGPLHLQILLLGTLPGSFPLFRLQLSRHPGLISFRMDWLDLLAVQGTLKSLLQHCSSKASILQCAAFFLLSSSHIHT